MPFRKSPRLAIISGGSAIEPVRMASLSRIGWRPSVWIDASSGRRDALARKNSRHRRVIEASDWRSVANEFDVAIVALPHALHGSTGIALLEAGKHVFMEAPLAMSGNESRQMLTVASRNGLVLSVGLYRRYLQVAHWTEALLLSGVLGEVERFDLRESMVFSFGVNSEALFQPNVAGGGALTDAGVHALDLLLWWLGDFASIGYRDDSEGGFEANCILECALTSGARGRFELSRTRQLCNSIRIEGARGFVEVDPHRNGVLAGSPNALAFRHDGVGPSEMRPQFTAELLDAEMKDFRTSVSAGDRAGIPGSEGVKSVELIERCYATRQPLVQPWAEAFAAAQSDGDLTLPTLPRGSKVLVIGATGFVGGRLVERLVDGRCAQVCCTVRNVGRAVRVARLPVELARVDLGNANEIHRAVDGIDYVFHCAHDTGARRQNIDGLRNIIEACVAHSVRRLIYVSSCAVYEPFPHGPLTEESPDGDRSNVYIDTKLEMERMISEASLNRGLQGTIVQPTIVYGPFCSPWTNTPAEKLIFGDVILPERGEGLCNAVYIDDVVDGLILAAVSPAAIGERFLISGPQPVTWAAFFTEIAYALGVKPPKFWPYQRIAEASHGTFQNFRAALDPKQLIRAVVRWNPVRHVLQAGLDSMPDSLRMRMIRYYFGSGKRRTRQIFLPSREALALYRAKAVASSEKARSRIGYKPHFDFQRGMMLTGRYLEWAYEDIGQSGLFRRDADTPKHADVLRPD